MVSRRLKTAPMNIQLAVEYIPRRMHELGYGDQYNIRFRHFVLQPAEERKIDGLNQLFLLIDPLDSIAVISDFGLYDSTASNVNELQYEHQGCIRIINYATTIQPVRFIQIIPKNEKQCL